MARGTEVNELVTVTWNTDLLDDMLKRVPKQVDDTLGKLALDTQANITASWNAQSPAPWNEPPGVDTGHLKNSVKARKISFLHWMVADWAGAGYSGDYGAHLEFGFVGRDGQFKGPWPWFRPALEHVLHSAKLIKAFDIKQGFD